MILNLYEKDFNETFISKRQDLFVYLLSKGEQRNVQEFHLHGILT